MFCGIFGVGAREAFLVLVPGRLHYIKLTGKYGAVAADINQCERGLSPEHSNYEPQALNC